MSRSSTYLNRIKAARAQLLDRGVVSDGLLPEPIGRSWLRCAETGLSLEITPSIAPIEHHELLALQEKNSRLLHQARPEMENLQSQISGTRSMIVLTDSAGTILHAVGDPQFINRAQRVALQPGVSWREESTGTNAIGTALVEQAPIMVNGAEHFFDQNAFLTCSAVPIQDPYGRPIGVLDVSGDYRQPQGHTMALVQMSAQMIENRLFRAEFTREITLHFHARPEFVGTLWEGIAVFSSDGRLLAINRSGLQILGIGGVGEFARFEAMFDAALGAALDAAKRTFPQCVELTARHGIRLYARLEPGATEIGSRTDFRQPVKNDAEKVVVHQMLNALDTGDPQMQKAVTSVKKILGRDISVLLEGETGTGKELLARAIHAAGSRQKSAFVAINCASIPEGLIEAELFGYEEGAFTGAKRQGVSGKIMKANGGTLFLDEIGEMPLQLQARLLRFLQDREVVPLGGGKGMVVDISVISATNRKLSLLVEQGRFREDLYYRLNGLRVVLPPLRQRVDIEVLVGNILREEGGGNVKIAADVMDLFERHPWRGNVRQLRNVLRAGLAFLEGDSVIGRHHLPEDFVEEFECMGHVKTLKHTHHEEASLGAAENILIRQALKNQNGNFTAAARQLGISRATLYRKVKRLGE